MRLSHGGHFLSRIRGNEMKQYIITVVSAAGGILLMYGITHDKAWYILGLSIIFACLRECRVDKEES